MRSRRHPRTPRRDAPHISVVKTTVCALFLTSLTATDSLCARHFLTWCSTAAFLHSGRTHLTTRTPLGHDGFSVQGTQPQMHASPSSTTLLTLFPRVLVVLLPTSSIRMVNRGQQEQGQAEDQTHFQPLGQPSQRVRRSHGCRVFLYVFTVFPVTTRLTVGLGRGSTSATLSTPQSPMSHWTFIQESPQNSHQTTSDPHSSVTFRFLLCLCPSQQLKAFGLPSIQMDASAVPGECITPVLFAMEFRGSARKLCVTFCSENLYGELAPLLFLLLRITWAVAMNVRRGQVCRFVLPSPTVLNVAPVSLSQHNRPVAAVAHVSRNQPMDGKVLILLAPLGWSPFRSQGCQLGLSLSPTIVFVLKSFTNSLPQALHTDGREEATGRPSAPSVKPCRQHDWPSPRGPAPR